MNHLQISNAFCILVLFSWAGTLQSKELDPLEPSYQQQVENGWLQDLNPTGDPVSVIQPKHIENALLLLNKTVDLLEKDNGTLSAQQASELEDVTQRWEKQLVPTVSTRAFFMSVRWLRRSILFANPKLDFEKILINRNPPTMFSHNGDQHLGRQSRSGPGLTLLSHWKVEPEALAFLDGKLPTGATRNPNLHWDANKVIFAFCDHEWAAAPELDSRGWANEMMQSAKKGELERRYFLYEAALDGTWVRQITGTKTDDFATQDGRVTAVVEDNDPCYLPDDSIAFISTRSQTFGRCHIGRYNPAWVLYRCAPDGGTIQQLSFGNENEYDPSIINDGRLVFSRWEYTSRHEMLFHMLWWCRTDGSGVANYYGNDTLMPMMVTEQTAIPGSHKVVATAMGHHQYTTGTIVVIDTQKGENGEEPLTHITPETPYPESTLLDSPSQKSSDKLWPKPHYSHPFPLSEHLFLVSRANYPIPHYHESVPSDNRAIYLIDDFGGREFIYEDPAVASVSPIPILPRPRPAMLPSLLAENELKPGTLFLQNVMLTRNDPYGKIKPGMIKSLRINAMGVQPRSLRRVCTPYVDVEIPKKVLGTVPVNPDGSACFNIPARTPIQVQALDADGRAVLTEKTFFYLQSGENRSCVGCHEPIGTSPSQKTMAGLMKQGPSQLSPAAGPDYPGGMAFAKTVQPVLDRYCITCHGLKKTAGGVNLLYEPFAPGKQPNKFIPAWLTDKKWTLKKFKAAQAVSPNSYMELTSRGDFSLGNKMYMWEDVRNISEAFEPLYARGCSVSDMILKTHGNVNMDADSRMRIFEWMDLNAPLTGDIFPGKNRQEDRTFDPAGMAALRKEIETQLDTDWASQPDSALVNRVFPRESRILMAPLSKQAGGWGQETLWTSTDDPNFKQMETLVMNSFICPKNENDMGWVPTAEKGASEPWVEADQAAYLEMIQNKKECH